MVGNDHDLPTRGGGPAPAPGPTGLVRHVKGIDADPVPLTDADIAELRDPVATLIFARGKRPQTINELLAAVNERNGSPDDLPHQVVYVASESAKLAPGAPVARRGRFVVIRTKDGDPFERDFLVSCPTHGQGFLQAIGWDDDAGVYNYYELLGSTWSLAGNSHHAFDPRSRGFRTSPFDSHINGTLVMKELLFPWVHWHSNITGGAFDAAFMVGNALGLKIGDIEGAENLERKAVIPGIERSVTVRLAQTASGPTVDDAPSFFRHLFGGTTVNLVTSRTRSNTVAAGSSVDLPPSFFSPNALLSKVGFPVAPVIDVGGAAYLAAIEEFDVAMAANGFRQPGDTFFAFPVPERAFEDDEVVRQLIAENLLTERFVATALMVDFPNPVFSSRSASLLDFVPDTLRPQGDQGLATDVIAAIVAAGGTPDTPAATFKALWELDDQAWKQEIEDRLAGYVSALNASLATTDGYRSIFLLAESRRREFKRQPLREFSLTVPTSKIPEDDPPLEMTTSAQVHLRP
jgi:hypothetical protein